MAVTMATSGACILKAGFNVNSQFVSGAGLYGTTSEEKWEQFINEAESYVNAATRINYTDTYASLNDDVKKIFAEAVTCLAACYAINYDMSGYTSRIEAQTMLDYLTERANRCINLIKDKKQTDFINAA